VAKSDQIQTIFPSPTHFIRPLICTRPVHTNISLLSSSSRLLSETLDGGMPGRSDPDPLDLDVQVILDELDIGLTVGGEGFKGGAFRNIRFPTWESLVLDFDLCEQVEIGRESFNLFTLEGVLGGDLDLLESIEDVELGQVQRGIAVDHGRVPHDDQIEPSTSPSTTGSDTPFSPDFLELNTNVLQIDSYGKLGHLGSLTGQRDSRSTVQ
jgi:hypothetical protein